MDGNIQEMNGIKETLLVGNNLLALKRYDKSSCAKVSLRRFTRKTALFVVVAAMCLSRANNLAAQDSFAQQFASHNSAMTRVQPSFVTTLVEVDPRLIQYARLAVSHQYAPTGSETVNFGNSRGAGIIFANRFQFDFSPPPYIQHQQPGVQDGFGDTSMLVKYRMVSGNSQHGNFILTSVLSHTFATGSYKNSAATDSFGPTLAGAIGIRKNFAVETTIGGTLPTGKIAVQGRSIAWNVQVQAHTTPHFWLATENNATLYVGGPHDGMMQNFVTPEAFYILRRKDWKPVHPFWVFDGGMQIATSRFHSYNHNLIAEVRLLF
jgi:hypothetical protein